MLREKQHRRVRLAVRGRVTRGYGVGALVSLLLLSGCSCEKEDPLSRGGDKRDPLTGLTQAEAQEVLVRVGDTPITLGDYVATLLRMDRYERLRYQTEERQKLLLDEMIEVELLAQEAKQRGLDKDPEVQLELQQALRDQLLQQLEASLPPLSDITEREVRAYYDAHRAEFKEPERRRVLVITVGDKALAETVIKEAEGASGQKWGELAKQYSLERSGTGVAEAAELAGDLGFVSAPGVMTKGPDVVPEAVRAAVFRLEKLGDVLGEPVSDGKVFFVVRLGGISPARDRTVTEADRAIRVELRRQKFLQAEKQLEADLRKKYPVVINDKAIEAYQPPVSL